MESTAMKKHTVYTIGAWGVLMVLTAASWLLGGDHKLPGLAHRDAAITILVITFAKVYVVGNAFMELREAAAWLTRIFAAWCVVLCLVLCAMYLAI